MPKVFQERAAGTFNLNSMRLVVNCHLNRKMFIVTKLSVRLPMLEMSPVITAFLYEFNLITFVHKSKHSFSVEISNGGGGMSERRAPCSSMCGIVGSLQIIFLKD